MQAMFPERDKKEGRSVMKKLLGCALVLLVFALLVSVSVSYAQQKVVTLRYSNYHAANNPNSMICEDWSKDVEKKTNGRVKISYYPGGTLTPPTQTYDSVIKGIADIGFSMAGYTKGRFPLTEVIDLPLGYKSGYQAGMMVNEFYKKFKPKEWDETKVMYLQTTSPMRLFMKNKPVNKIEDLKGLKIRGTGTATRYIQLLGAAPVGLPITECYDALSKGVVDGIGVAYEPLKPFKLAEVVSYGIEYSATYATAGWIVMNKQKWESISPEDQKAIEALNDEYAEKQARLWDVLDKDGKDLFLQKGGKVIKLSPEEDARWTKAVAPIIDEYIKAMKAKGLPGDETVKFCVDYLKAHP
jgi:TRAP-type C4-dicarboxylate transport system substrate-binding protein